MSGDQAWRERARCAQDDQDPEDWFAERGGGPAWTLRIRHARQVCLVCPVRQECLDDALATEHGLAPKSRPGIRAGLSGWQRHDLAKGRAVRLPDGLRRPPGLDPPDAAGAEAA